ncbi:hypothetical protein DPEC_G00275530 [Dallia pectoralis]|uniref:Uncharacterized protein n=1 Tax=Dallia pectoralis TaxID=75939 RepID=A0ACC2FLH3_DALPE|nr:hypothetical protein DPEC_G00275530 [Dallia pectoralis]
MALNILLARPNQGAFWVKVLAVSKQLPVFPRTYAHTPRGVGGERRHTDRDAWRRRSPDVGRGTHSREGTSVAFGADVKLCQLPSQEKPWTELIKTSFIPHKSLMDMYWKDLNAWWKPVGRADVAACPGAQKRQP